MPKIALTLPLHRVGEPAVDLPDLFKQLDGPEAARWEITVRRIPGKQHHHTVTVDGVSV